MLEMAEAVEINENCHERGLSAIRQIDMNKVRGMNYIPKSLDSWHDQYPYACQDDLGNPLKLTSELIDSLLIEKVYGSEPQIYKKHVK